MSNREARGAKQTRRDVGLVLGLGVIWAFAHWQIVSAILWGVTLCDSRSYRKLPWPFREWTNCRLETDISVFWPSLIPWIVLGPFLLGGTFVFLWIQRNERP